MATQTYLRRTNTVPTSLRMGTRHQSTILQDTSYPDPMPWPEPFQFSIPFSTKHLDGYFLTYQPRINTSTAEKETEVILRVHQEWFDRGGCQVRDGALSVDGGPVLSIVFPEAEPRRLLNLAAIVSIGYIHDDWVGQELLCNRNGHGDKESNMKKFGAIINQMKSKAITEMLENDSSLISVTQIFGARETRSLEAQDVHLEFQGLDHYLEEKYISDTWSRLPSILPYVYDIKLSKDQLARYTDLIRLITKINILIKDIYSAERDWSSHISHNKLGIPVSAVYIMMQTQEVPITQAKKLVERKCLELEQQFLRLSWELLDNTDAGIREEAARYISALQHLVAGELSWHAGSNRYRLDPNDPFYPKPEYKLSDFPQDNRGLATSVQVEWSGYESRSNSPNLSGATVARSRSMSGFGDGHGKGSSFAEELMEFESDIWTEQSPKLSEEAVLKPFEYLLSQQSKKISTQAIQALDFWYNVPRRALDIISGVIDMQHGSSSMIDDVEESPSKRQGNASTHMVFGTPQSVNTANYLFVKCLQEVQKLPHSLSAVEIFTDELTNLSLGRGYNINWAFRSSGPSERDYIKMIDGKTGSLFRLAARLMKVEATQNKDLNVDGLVTLIGRYFQIRDDHKRLSASTAQGDHSSLDEGKYSLALVHSLNNSNPGDREQLESLLLLRSRQGRLFPEQKSLVMKILARTGSMGYSMRVMERLENEIERRLEAVEATIPGAERNWTMRAIMEYLRVGGS
ncbi:hypothetical protein TWF730_008254 [Orbilia blumenaviensis]|uniref:Uncharacterized protein n=1 Tax=Orbilia blumenaviensis TaxID=1796055 RepID=A0AAV9V434_9PEZI